MAQKTLRQKLRALGWRLWRSIATHVPRFRDDARAQDTSRTHVILLDGTMSSLREGQETSIGLIFRLLGPSTAKRTTYYAPGLQWGDWRSNLRVVTGQGLGHQIRQAYGTLASRYEAGDKIYIFGYSRGAFAARSLVGMIHEIGLLHPHAATPRNIQMVWRLYQDKRTSEVVTNALCQTNVPIQFLGVFDTVSALACAFRFCGSFCQTNTAFIPTTSARIRVQPFTLWPWMKHALHIFQNVGIWIKFPRVPMWNKSGFAEPMVISAVIWATHKRFGDCQIFLCRGCWPMRRNTGLTCPRIGGNTSPVMRLRPVWAHGAGWENF